MSPTPLKIADIGRVTLVQLAKRVRDLELHVYRKSAATLEIILDALKDVRVTGAVDHQVLTYIAGEWLARGGPTIKGFATDSGTGDLSVSIDLVDGDWDTTRACHVEVSMLIDPAFDAVGVETTTSVTLDGDPYTLVIPDDAGISFEPAPLATLQLLDATAGPGAPSANVEVATRSWPVGEPFTVGGETGGSISWTFTGGVPHVEANIAGVDTDAWPESHAIYVIWRLTPLP